VAAIKKTMDIEIQKCWKTELCNSNLVTRTEKIKRQDHIINGVKHLSI
jgi:hypothetical protein